MNETNLLSFRKIYLNFVHQQQIINRVQNEHLMKITDFTQTLWPDNSSTKMSKIYFLLLKLKVSKFIPISKNDICLQFCKSRFFENYQHFDRFSPLCDDCFFLIVPMMMLLLLMMKLMDLLPSFTTPPWERRFMAEYKSRFDWLNQSN